MSLEGLAEDLDWLRRLARRLVVDPADADDLTHEAWLAAQRRGGGAQPMQLSWLAGTVRNLARMARRDVARRRERERRAARPEATRSTERDSAPSPNATTEEDLALLGHRRLLEAVFELPEAQRRVLVLRFWRDLTPTEIAAQLGDPVGAVKGRLRRALAQLRARVVDAEDDTDGARGRAALSAFAASGPRPRFLYPSASTATTLIMGKHVAFTVLALCALFVLVRSFAHETGSRQAAVAEPSRGATTGEVALVVAEAPIERVPAPRAAEDLWTVDRLHDLHGVVLDASGAPSSDATVFVHGTHWGNPMALWAGASAELGCVAELRTDMQGRFRVPLELGQFYDVIAEAPGCGRVTAGRRLAGERIVLQLTAPRRVFGRVLLDGAPVPEALVRLGPKLAHSIASQLTVDTVRTDSEGRYEVARLAPGAYLVEPSAPGLVALWPTLVDVAHEDVERDLELERGRVVRGRVVEAATGSPVAGCSVRVGVTGVVAAAESDADGRFAIEGVVTRPREGLEGGNRPALVASATGYLTHVAPMPFESTDDESTELLVELQHGASIQGRIVLAGRTAMPSGARISVCTLEHAWSTLARFKWQHGRLEADGRFSLRGVPSGLAPIYVATSPFSAGHRAQSALVASAPGYATRIWVLPPIQAEVGVLEVGNLALPHSASVSGVVVDQAGAPLPHAMVTVSPELCWLGDLQDEWRGVNAMIPAWLGSVTLETDDLGRFYHGDLPPGPLTLQASVEGGLSTCERQLVVDEGQALGPIELALDLQGIVAGEVVDEAGRAVAGAVVMVTPSVGREAFVTYSNGMGQFQALGLGEGGCTLQVWTPMAGPRSTLSMPTSPQAVAVGTTDLKFVLRSAVVAHGVVRDHNGAPTPRARIKLVLEGEETPIELTVDAEGRFERRMPRAAKAEVWVAPARDANEVQPHYTLSVANWIISDVLLEVWM